MNKREKLLIFGNGEFGEVACMYLQKDSPYEVAAFTAHSEHIRDRRLLGLPVIPFETVQETHPPKEYKMFVAIAYRDLNRVRARIYHETKAKGYTLISYVSSKTNHWDDLRIGDNCFIFENNVIQPYVTIGNDVILWSGNHIGHHSTIGDHSFVASHAVISGRVRIGSYCFIGVNATIRDHIVVSDECTIGAGALVMKDTKKGEVYAATSTKPRE